MGKIGFDEGTASGCRAVASLANHDNRALLVLGEGVQLVVNLGNGDIDSAGYVGFVELVIVSNINNHSVATVHFGNGKQRRKGSKFAKCRLENILDKQKTDNGGSKEQQVMVANKFYVLVHLGGGWLGDKYWQ